MPAVYIQRACGLLSGRLVSMRAITGAGPDTVEPEQAARSRSVAGGETAPWPGSQGEQARPVRCDRRRGSRVRLPLPGGDQALCRVRAWKSRCAALPSSPSSAMRGSAMYEASCDARSGSESGSRPRCLRQKFVLPEARQRGQMGSDGGETRTF